MNAHDVFTVMLGLGLIGLGLMLAGLVVVVIFLLVRDYFRDSFLGGCIALAVVLIILMAFVGAIGTSATS